MKILKIKERDVDRGWNGPVSLSAKVKGTLVKKGYKNVQLNGTIYSVSILTAGVSRLSVAWLGDKLGEINQLGHFVKENK